MNNQKNKLLLMFLCGLTEQDYENHVFELAIEWLEYYMKHDALGLKALKQESHFWNWWTMHFNRRNAKLIDVYTLAEWGEVIPSPGEARFFRNEFLRIHSIAELNIHPNRIVLASAFNNIFHNVIEAQ